MEDAPSWQEIASSPKFQELPEKEQTAVRSQYFNEVVVPQLDEKDISKARDEFNARAAAMESEIVLHLMSRHPGNEGKYNETNTGAGVRIPITENTSFGAGTYRNSLDKQSNYVGLIQKIMQLGPVDIGVGGGIISGYLDKPVPFVTPEASMKVGPGTVRVNVVPPVKFGGKTVDPAIGLSYGIPFKTK